MNCIYCGKPIEEHEARRQIDKCVFRALGYDSAVLLQGYSPSITYWYCTEMTNYLTADDNPVERFMMFWDRSDGQWCITLEGWYPMDGITPEGVYHVKADTRPLALCRAVLTLEAVEAEND